VVALLGYAGGARGGELIKVVWVTLAVVGGLSVLVAVVLDPMGAEFHFGQVGAFGPLSALPGSSIPEGTERVTHLDDVLYAGGIVLIGAAVLVAVLV
jgi:hypothetical protein